ncbi:hypothetical protein H9X85_07350 [Anaerotignum lactatifermentans]|uniref:Uncharacterized protein n=1 Tax=Anaerotignum lactatifermentans TaxID=160404 RepID=A0ABS2GBC6_9FIRM|nr:hypothetical protein [Anaerotignum lactatifermentans]MBM6829446.1 hypothetical protein [Anaerotignum lactatifermentans]MBM6877804.1 hypothetical protein [Anaerotignum lactatifermentans]MBM6951023.1 hypothetical protein [Anaerotignum lactatifermentans]
MQYQQKQKWKRRAFAVIAVMIAVIMVLGLLSPAFAAEAAVAVEVTDTVTVTPEEEAPVETPEEEMGQSSFSADFSIGFDGKYIVGEMTPFSGQITNLAGNFKGELRLKTYLYGNDSRNFQSYALYAQPLELPQGATEQISMEIGIGSVRKYMEVELVDQQERVVYRKNVPVEALAPETVAVAVLSSQPEQLNYLSSLADLLPAERNQVFFLDGSQFPSEQVVMENFDLVVIDDFDTSVLTAQQKGALESWLRSGGLLILGTGPHANRVLSGLTFLGDIRTAGSGTVSAFTDLAGGSVTLSQPMQTAVLESELLRQYWEDNGTVLASTLTCGGGNVLLYHFSLGLTPFSNLPNASALVADSCLRWSGDQLELASDVETNYMDHYADRFPGMDNGGIWLVFGCIIVYMVLVGPVLYVVLKKKEKQVLGWVCIPVMAFVFLGAALLCSMGSAYKDSMLSVVSVIDVAPEASYGRADIGITVKSPKKGDLVLAMEDQLPVLPKMEDYYYFSGENTEECEYRVEAGETNRLTFYDLSTWESCELTARSIVDLGGTVQCQVRTEGSVVYCLIENDSNVDFVDAYIRLHEQYLPLGELPAGESREVSLDTEAMGEDTLRNTLRTAVWGGETSMSQLAEQGTITRQEAFRLNLEEDLLNMYDSDRGEGYFDSEQEICTFFGFSDAPLLTGAKTVNGKEPRETNLHLYHIPVRQDLAKMEQFSLPYMIGPQATETNGQGYDLYYDSWEGRHFLSPYGEEERDVTLKYQVDSDLRIDLFQFRLSSQSYVVSQKTEIYNLRTGQWEILQEVPYENTADYVDGDNTILVRLHLMGSDTVITPEMRMEGGGKYA